MIDNREYQLRGSASLPLLPTTVVRMTKLTFWACSTRGDRCLCTSEIEHHPTRRRWGLSHTIGADRALATVIAAILVASEAAAMRSWRHDC